MFLRKPKEDPKLSLAEITALLRSLLSDYTTLGKYRVLKIRETARSNQTMLKDYMVQLNNGGMEKLSFTSMLELLGLLSQFDNHYLQACRIHGVKVDVSSLLTHWFINRVKNIITDQDQLGRVMALLPESQHDHFKQMLSTWSVRSGHLRNK